jgi:hypothetical protein
MSKKYDDSFIKDLNIGNYKIDLSQPGDKVLDERETRKRLLTHARLIGCEREMLILFSKYDKLIKNCKNDKEREDIAQLACADVYTLLGRGGELYVNGKLVMKDS